MYQRILVVSCLVVLTSGLAYRAGTAAQPPKANDKDSLSVRYAQAQLRLAELTLQKAQSLNQRMANTITPAMVSLFSDDVEFAKSQLQAVKSTGKLDSYQGLLRRAELSLRTAEQNLKKITEADKLMPGTFDASDLERLKINVELAKVRLERGKALANADPQTKLQWQVELLNDDVARLKEQQAMIVQNRLSEFF
jgi:Tfp pilus assembly protein PilX